MLTIQDTYRSSYNEKGSKFIGLLFPALSKEAFNQQLAEIKSEHRDATHHCYGWRIGVPEPAEFAQDDGEPSGTAGLPILNQLKSNKSSNCGCVVIRYYGGTKLGKPGLIQAYSAVAEDCLRQASFKQLIPTQNFKIIYDYSQQKIINQLNNSFDLKELDAEYLEKVTLTIACRATKAEQLWEKLQQHAHLGIEAEELSTDFLVMT